MPTFIGEIVNRQIIFNALISVPKSQGVQQGTAANVASYKTYKALLDTGAQRTMISQKVVSEVGLQGIGHQNIIPVSGSPIRTRKFRVRLDIPIDNVTQLPNGNVQLNRSLRGKDMEVALLPYLPRNYDILLGMDLISEFHLTIHLNNFIMSN